MRTVCVQSLDIGAGQLQGRRQPDARRVHYELLWLEWRVVHIPRRLHRFWRKGGCLVGVWTGPDRDLLCVRECDTSIEAEKWLAPPGRMILDATLRSLWVRWSVKLTKRHLA